MLTRCSRSCEQGSAPVETIFSILFLLLVVLGVIELAFALYGRNVVVASAHEGARAAIELERDPSDAVATARQTVRQAAGGLVEELNVRVSVASVGTRFVVRVRVAAALRGFGPVPLAIPVTAVATASRANIMR